MNHRPILFSLLAAATVTSSAPAQTCDPAHREAEAFRVEGRQARMEPLRQSDFTEAMWETVTVSDGVSVEPHLSAKRHGEISDMLATMVRHPELYGSHLALARQLLRTGTLSSRDREIAILRVGWLSQAPYEWGAHVKIAKRAGITPEEIERLKQGANEPGWAEHDQAIIRAAEELHYHSMISDGTWQTLAGRLDEKQLIELVLLIGQYKTVAYYQNSLRLELPPDNKGFAAR